MELSCLWSLGTLAGGSCHRPPRGPVQGRGGKGRAQADSLAGPRGPHLVQALKKQRETDPRKVLRTQSGRGREGSPGGQRRLWALPGRRRGCSWHLLVGTVGEPKVGRTYAGAGRGLGGGVGCTDLPSMTSVSKTIRQRRDPSERSVRGEPAHHREQPCQSAAAPCPQ